MIQRLAGVKPNREAFFESLLSVVGSVILGKEGMCQRPSLSCYGSLFVTILVGLRPIKLTAAIPFLDRKKMRGL